MATIEKLEHDQVKLTIEIDADTFNAALQQAYVKNGKHYNIAGFRKGKAPRKVIERAYSSRMRSSFAGATPMMRRSKRTGSPQSTSRRSTSRRSARTRALSLPQSCSSSPP